MARKSKKWSEKLAEPIRVGNYDPVSFEPNTEFDMLLDIVEKRFEKLNLLLEHYNLNAQSDEKGPNWRMLAYLLACDFIPGFQAKPAKQCSGMNSREAYCFYRYIQNLIDEEGLTTAQAIEVLCSQTNKETKSDLEREFRLIKNNKTMISTIESIRTKYAEKFPDEDSSLDLKENAILYITRGGKK